MTLKTIAQEDLKNKTKSPKSSQSNSSLGFLSTKSSPTTAEPQKKKPLVEQQQSEKMMSNTVIWHYLFLFDTIINTINKLIFVKNNKKSE